MYSLPRLRNDLFLLENIATSCQIIGNKLPTKRQVLKVLFFYTRHLNKTIKDGIKLVISEVTLFWNKANIPTQQYVRCCKKLQKLYEDYRGVQKKAGKYYNKQKEDNFSRDLTLLFDIAHGDVFEKISEKGKAFLVDQRLEKPLAYIGGINPVMYADQLSEVSKDNKSQEEKSDHNQDLLEGYSCGEFEKLPSSQAVYSSESQSSCGSNYLLQGRNYKNKNERGKINVMTENVVTVLDNCKISYRQSVLIIAAIADALNHDIKELILNKSSYHKWRNEIRKRRAKNLKEIFNGSSINAGVIHWDGKIIPDIISCKQVDRLPIILSNGQMEQILDVPALEDGKGISQANAIYNALNSWGLCDSIKALCCDTTNANLGHKSGAAVILEKLLDNDLLYLPCRHHIFEIILAATFDQKLPGTSGPNVPLFKRFSNSWNTLDKSRYKDDLAEKGIHPTLIGKVKDVTILIQNYLNEFLPRDDYKEFLKLCLIFLKVMPSDKVKFRKPGAFHHARWMAKAIYSLKIYLFRESFHLTSKEEKGLFEICQFLVFVYVKAWFTAPVPVKAPNHDLKFIKKLHDYQTVDDSLAKVALQKFQNHLWYLSPEASAMSFFDDEISIDIKRAMQKSLFINKIHEDINSPKRFYINDTTNMQDLQQREMDFFINNQSLLFFERFGINKQFLQLNCEMWTKDDDYLQGLQIVKELRVVNDTAERTVHLTEQYINVLTKDEQQKQYLIQIVSEFKKNTQEANKETVIKKFKNN
ncbi:hypothetical protein ALC62_15995 [Cyphomyrmex costatus]|uniref:Uncharacterized protein n=1 Tax=Cyphomyrmex costatus TaxID=456900 RepID=A0A151I690_9HYME|nr:hypothetical protein ALC62_15995 [Cyphomyrmex costatus]